MATQPVMDPPCGSWNCPCPSSGQRITSDPHGYLSIFLVARLRMSAQTSCIWTSGIGGVGASGPRVVGGGTRGQAGLQISPTPPTTQGP